MSQLWQLPALPVGVGSYAVYEQLTFAELSQSALSDLHSALPEQTKPNHFNQLLAILFVTHTTCVTISNASDV